MICISSGPKIHFYCWKHSSAVWSQLFCPPQHKSKNVGDCLYEQQHANVSLRVLWLHDEARTSNTVTKQNKTAHQSGKTEGLKNYNNLIFSHGASVPSIVTQRRLKWTKTFLAREAEKNTYGSSLGKKWRKKNQCASVKWHTAQSFAYPLWCDANRLSKRISIHASLKERVFKLTFRWKWHWGTSRVRDHRGVGGLKNIHSSKSFCMPQGGAERGLELKSPPPHPPFH